MDGEALALLMCASFIGMLFVGVPVAIALLISGFAFGYLGFGMTLFNLIPLRIYGVATNYTLLAVPLFVFMGVMLERSRLAEDLLDVIGFLCGPLPGGMGLAIVLVGVLMGAATGIVGATFQRCPGRWPSAATGARPGTSESASRRSSPTVKVTNRPHMPSMVSPARDLPPEFGG